MSTRLRWAAVVPVKRTDVAKSRLTGVSDETRRRLARAFATDTVSALLGCRHVDEVVVVTDDATATRALTDLGAIVVPDEPDAGLNPALSFGAEVAAARGPDRGVALVSADLPALRCGDMNTVLRAAEAWEQAFVCDAAGVGTTIVTARPGTRLRPCFGFRSRAAHRVAGFSEIRVDDASSARRDVDTWVDLWDAIRLGVGPATRAVLAER